MLFDILLCLGTQRKLVDVPVNPNSKTPFDEFVVDWEHRKDSRIISPQDGIAEGNKITEIN